MAAFKNGLAVALLFALAAMHANAINLECN